MHELVSRQLFEEGLRGLTADLTKERGWTIHTAAFPTVDVSFAAPGRQPIRARFVWDGWDAQPPSVEWLTPDGAYLTALPSSPRGQLNSSAHDTTGRPFVCMVGVREYHTHPSHRGDLWDNYRGRAGYDLGGIITQVWRAWGEARP